MEARWLRSENNWGPISMFSIAKSQSQYIETYIPATHEDITWETYICSFVERFICWTIFIDSMNL